MRQPLSSYRDTPTSWTVTQGQIVTMLNKHGIDDFQFTHVGQETAARSGLDMDPDTVAIMLVFQKAEALPDGRAGNIPVRIVVPNVPKDKQSLNQYYRLLYWYMKSKFEAIETGLVEFAEEFMAHLQITDNRGGVGRLWERFKNNYYRAIGNGETPGTNLLPPMIDRGDDK